MERKTFLNKVSLERALHLLEEAIISLDLKEHQSVEMVETSKSQGRITASSVLTSYPVPHYRAAAMDGVAIRAEKTFSLSPQKPAAFRLDAELIMVDTGDPVPLEYDAVIKIEEIRVEDGMVEISHPATPGQHIRSVGEDLPQGGLVVPANQRLGAAEIGALLGCGVTEVEVKASPQPLIIPTGSELVSPGKDPKPGEVVEFNSSIVSTLARLWGAEPFLHQPVPDDPDLIRKVLLEQAKKHRLLVTIAGSSAGREDYLASIIEGEGELLLHGVAIRPGKPLVLGILPEERALVVGLPGYPVSAYLDSHLFLRPLIYELLGYPAPPLKRVPACLGQSLVSSPGLDEFLRVVMGRVGERRVVHPLPRGASILSSLVKGDGFLQLKRMNSGMPQGAEVEVELLEDKPLNRSPIFLAGSQDPLLNTLKDLLSTKAPGLALTSVGRRRGPSGLSALKEDTVHLAGVYIPHLEREEDYNFLLERLELDRAMMVNLVVRSEDQADPLYSCSEASGYRYELLFRYRDQDFLKELLELLRSPLFKEAVESQKASSSSLTGRITELRSGGA